MRLEKDSTVKFHQICDLMAEATQKDKTIRELDEDLECLRELERSASERHVDCKDKAKELGKRLYAAETNCLFPSNQVKRIIFSERRDRRLQKGQDGERRAEEDNGNVGIPVRVRRRASRRLQYLFLNLVLSCVLFGTSF